MQLSVKFGSKDKLCCWFWRVQTSITFCLWGCLPVVELGEGAGKEKEEQPYWATEGQGHQCWNGGFLFRISSRMINRSVDKEMLTSYLWLPPSWIEITLVTAVQLMPTANQSPSCFLWSTFQPISLPHGEAALIQWLCNFVLQWERSTIAVRPV